MKTSAALLAIATLAIFTSISLGAGPLGILGKDKNEPQVKSAYQNFHYDKNADWERLKKVCVQPVDVSAVAGFAEASTLASLFREQFCNELKTRAGKTWTLVETPDNETAILKLSITRLSKNPQDSAISFAGTVVDSKTGAIIMNFSDTKPYDANTPNTIKTWASDFAEMSMPDPEKDEKKSRLRKVARVVGFHFGMRKFME